MTNYVKFFDYLTAARLLADIFIQYDLAEYITADKDPTGEVMADRSVAITAAHDIENQQIKAEIEHARAEAKDKVLYDLYWESLPFAGLLDYFEQVRQEKPEIGYFEFMRDYLDEEACLTALKKLVDAHNAYSGYKG